MSKERLKSTFELLPLRSRTAWLKLGRKLKEDQHPKAVGFSLGQYANRVKFYAEEQTYTTAHTASRRAAKAKREAAEQSKLVEFTANATPADHELAACSTWLSQVADPVRRLAAAMAYRRTTGPRSIKRHAALSASLSHRHRSCDSNAQA